MEPTEMHSTQTTRPTLALIRTGMYDNTHTIGALNAEDNTNDTQDNMCDIYTEDAQRDA